MSCNIKKYLNEIQKEILGNNPGIDPVKKVLSTIVNSGDATAINIVEHYLTEQYNEAGIEVDNLSITDKGAIKFPDGKVKDLDSKVRDIMFDKTEQDVSGFDMKAITQSSVYANKLVSYMLIQGTEEGASKMAPYVKRWHKAAKEKSGIYKETVNLVSKGFGNSELLAKMKAHMFLTGKKELPRQKIADVTSVAYESARRSYEILDTYLPALDKKIEKAIKDKTRREKLDKIFGTSGYANMYEIPGLMDAVYDGKSTAELKTIINANKADTEAAKNLKSYLVDRKIIGNTQNSGGNKKVAALAAVLALEDKFADGTTGYHTLQWLKTTHPAIFVELDKLSANVHTLDMVVNQSKQGTSFGSGSNVFHSGYDGHGTMDVFDTTQEFKLVTMGEFSSDKYQSSNSPWTVIRRPGKENLGIVARKGTTSSMEGLGVNQNRIQNGMVVPKHMVKLDRAGVVDINWLQDNNIVVNTDAGYPSYRLVLDNKEFDAASGKRNIADRLYRTYVHNKQLVETEKVRDLIKETLVLSGQEGMLKTLNSTIRFNGRVKVDDRKEVTPFLKTDVDFATIAREYPEVAKRYKKVENISNYGNFDKEIQYVRRDIADMLTGHPQKALISDEYPSLQKWESIYKEAVQLFKLKLVVANPAKLGVDILSNFGMLMTMDVNPIDAIKYYKEALEYSGQMSQLEGKLVQAKVELAFAEAEGKGVEKHKALVAKADNDIKVHPYYDALRFGFVQSMGTSMMIKEFDTISGLQHTIDELVTKLTVEKSTGNKTAVHKAIKWWMDAGFGANDILDAVSGISLVKGTQFSEELIEISRKLKDKKETEDTVRYVSEFIAAPSSEIIRQGSRIMQLGDTTSRWALYQTRVTQGIKKFKVDHKRVPDKNEIEAIKKDASIDALDAFIDYRLNMPQEVKMLSDYGVLMFPSFWMRAQKVIYNLAKYHPINSGMGYFIADWLGIGGASILDANVLSKVGNNTLLHAGQFDGVLSPGTYIWGL